VSAYPPYNPDPREQALNAFLDRTVWFIVPLAYTLAAYQVTRSLTVTWTVGLITVVASLIMWVRSRMAGGGITASEYQQVTRDATRQYALWWRIAHPAGARIAGVAVPVVAIIVGLAVTATSYAVNGLGTGLLSLAPVAAGVLAAMATVILLAHVANQVTAFLQQRES